GAGDAPGQPGSPPSGAEGRGRTYGPTAEGSQVLSAGKTVISSNTSSIGTKKGSTPLMTRVTGICVTEDRTNSTSPTGGVSSPIIRLKMTITAKWVPSMPKMSAIGASTGTMIKIAAVGSRIAPTTSSRMLTSNRNTSGR